MGKREIAIEVLSELGGVEARQIGPQMELVADLGIDSPKALQLLVELEDRLGIEISDEDAARMETVGDIFNYIGNLA